MEKTAPFRGAFFFAVHVAIHLAACFAGLFGAGLACVLQ